MSESFLIKTSEGTQRFYNYQPSEELKLKSRLPLNDCVRSGGRLKSGSAIGSHGPFEGLWLYVFRRIETIDPFKSFPVRTCETATRDFGASSHTNFDLMRFREITIQDEQRRSSVSWIHRRYHIEVPDGIYCRNVICRRLDEHIEHTAAYCRAQSYG
jgi:hypothetical protein